MILQCEVRTDKTAHRKVESASLPKTEPLSQGIRFGASVVRQK
ncbi:hypothetical protein [Anabaena sp. CCY 0017]